MYNQLRTNSLIRIAWAPSVVLLLHIIATIGGWYEAIWWLDIPLHFLGGVAIAISAFHLLEDFSGRQKFHNQFSPLQILVLIAFVGLAAVCWEFMEYAFDTVFKSTMQPGILDTIKDMAVGLTGGALTSILTVWKSKK